jgi:hypothetical protein
MTSGEPSSWASGVPKAYYEKLVYMLRYLKQVNAKNQNISFSVILIYFIISMLTKQSVLKSINDLPDKFSIDEIIERLLLLQKIEVGINQADNGEAISTAEAKKKLNKWLQ